MPPMDIVILGAIPHSITAKASEAYIEKQAPVFARLLQTHQANPQWLDIAKLGCTPFEYYQLSQAGYQASNGFYAPGLAPLRCPHDFSISHPSQPIYLMELTHVEMGLNAASLYLAEELNISEAESEALFESAHALLAGGALSLSTHQGTTALITMSKDLTSVPLMSPALLATGHLNDWQTPSDLPRALRNVLSELQMVWHHHPVNIERETRGLKTINSAWIYGGAALTDISSTPPQVVNHTLTQATQNTTTQIGRYNTSTQPDRYQLIDTLFFPHLHQDWEKWLLQLPELDKQLIPLLDQGYRFILCGFDRLVTLTPKSFLSHLLTSKNAWKQWWVADDSL